MIDSFTTWLQSKQSEIEHVSKLLSTQIASDPNELIEDASQIEAWGSRVGELLANAEGYLSAGKLFYLPEAGDLREIERKAIVEAKIADIRKVRDILENLRDCIKTRISLVQSILRYEKPLNPMTMADPNQGMRSAADIMRGR